MNSTLEKEKKTQTQPLKRRKTQCLQKISHERVRLLIDLFPPKTTL
jgi:hypothetical protein